MRRLREGDEIESVRFDANAGEMIPVVRVGRGKRLGFRARCGAHYTASKIRGISLSANRDIAAGYPDALVDHECIAQQLLAEGLVGGPEWT